METNVDILDAGYPLLVKFKELCPGTYAHSRNISEVLDTCGNELGLNSRRLKAAGLYHDIGKMMYPEMFSENQPQDVNIHDALDPFISFILISGHVSHTIHILHNDPNFDVETVDICAQHHGTTLGTYFFNKSDSKDVEKYRYKCKRPQSFEALLLMLCDHLEARTRSELNSGRITGPSDIETLVDTVFDHLVDDAQFDDVSVPNFKILRSFNLLLKHEFVSLFHDHKRVDYKEEASAAVKV